MNRKNQTAIFPKGEKVSPVYFIGTARVNILVAKDESGNFSMGNMVFETGCRNNWHTHAEGQILLVTHGKGFYQERGKRARSLSIGDEVVIQPGVEHWQGAAHDSSFTHLVITKNSAEAAVKWLEPVTDEAYSNILLQTLSLVFA